MNKTAKYVLAISVASFALAACNKPVTEESAQVTAPATDAVNANLPQPKIVATEFQLGTVGDAASELKTHCAIDRINGQAISTQPLAATVGSNIDFSGWVADPAMHVPAQFSIELTGVDVYAASASAGFPRPDLVRVLKQEGLANAGFNVRARLGAVAPGEYAVSLIQDAGGSTARCVTSARITVAATPAL